MTKGRCLYALPLRHSLVLRLHAGCFTDGSSGDDPGQMFAVVGLRTQVTRRAGALGCRLCSSIDGINTRGTHQCGFDRRGAHRSR